MADEKDGVDKRIRFYRSLQAAAMIVAGFTLMFSVLSVLLASGVIGPTTTGIKAGVEFAMIVPIMFILGPILFPLLAKMGVSEVQFGVIMVLNLMIGMITPPIGLNLFVIAAIGGEDIMRIFRAAIPYFFALVLVLLAITYIPALTMALPQWVYGAR